MKIYLPDRTEPLVVPFEGAPVIADVKRAMASLGYNLENATGSVDEAGDVHFARPTSGAKG